jgi:hypothetical protein
MSQGTTELALPLDTENMQWIPTGPGQVVPALAVRCGRLVGADAPGAGQHRRPASPHWRGARVQPVRHPGDHRHRRGRRPRRLRVRAARHHRHLGRGRREPCIVHIKVVGAVEYLGDDGQVTETVTSA